MIDLAEDPDLRATLRSLSAAGALGTSPRRGKLLAYLLREELAGRGGRITAYSIGVDVLGKGEDFDPNEDAIVRAEVGRLRRALEHYYATSGRLDPVRITIPPRQNRPVIERRGRRRARRRWRPVLAAACLVLALMAGFLARPWLLPGRDDAALSEPFAGPRVAVLPFEVLGEGADSRTFARGLRIDMATELSRFDWLSVFVSEAASVSAIPAEVDYVLTGSIRADAEEISATLNLLRPGTGEILWTDVFRGDRRAARLIEMEQQAAERIAVEIARPEGLIADLERRRVLRDTTDSDLAYACVFLLYEFWRTVSPGDHARLKACLEEALPLAPDYAEAHAAMAVVFVEEARGLTIPASVADPLAEAQRHSRRALELAPRSTLAVRAAFEVMAMSGELDDARRIGRAAVANAPNNPDMLADYGLMLALRLGQFDEGLFYARRALELNPDPPIWYRWTETIDAYMRGDLAFLRNMAGPALQARPIVGSAVMLGLESRAGNFDLAEAYYNRLVPEVVPSLEALLPLVRRGAGFHDSIMEQMESDFRLFAQARLSN